MGRAIEAEAHARGHQISHRIGSQDADVLRALGPDAADVAIEFTHPTAVLGNLRQLIPTGLPLVVGTTGWLGQVSEVAQLVQEAQSGLVHGANFSLGVNVMLQANRRLAQLMNRFPSYDVALEDRHHRHKADSPSGTALLLAHDILRHLDRKTQLADMAELRHRPPQPHELSLSAIRAGEIPGTHTILYTSPVDTITLRHTAHSRAGFALGAVLAAEWVCGKYGMHEFSEIFDEIES
jgi:4-hydroxy-tetrahydrodipicolinate reductase